MPLDPMGMGIPYLLGAQKVVSWICFFDAWNEVKHFLPNGGLKFNGDLPRVPNLNKAP